MGKATSACVARARELAPKVCNRQHGSTWTRGPKLPHGMRTHTSGAPMIVAGPKRGAKLSRWSHVTAVNLSAVAAAGCLDEVANLGFDVVGQKQVDRRQSAREVAHLPKALQCRSGDSTTSLKTVLSPFSLCPPPAFSPAGSGLTRAPVPLLLPPRPHQSPCPSKTWILRAHRSPTACRNPSATSSLTQHFVRYSRHVPAEQPY